MLSDAKKIDQNEVFGDEKNTIKNTDLSLSNICMGAANFKERLNRDSALNLLDYYFDTGGNFIDTANIFGHWFTEAENCSEQFIG